MRSLCLLLLCSLLGSARHFHSRTKDSLVHRRRTALNGPHDSANSSLGELERRDGTKYVFMHHIVGNTYSFTQADWEDDITRIQANGVDAIALNIGQDSWQLTQITSAYAAAEALGSALKLFISFDFTAITCDTSIVVSYVNQFKSHSNQFLVNGKPMISSYSGDCLGNSGWASIKSQTNGYLMPFIWGQEGNFGSWPSLDSWYCWGCAWPNGDIDKTTDDDNYYISQLGTRYATTISGWMFTHYSYKNFYQRGDDWLINTRWEQLIAMRDKLTFVEMITWNDFGESDYFGPIKGAEPSGTTWADGFPHTAWFDMSQYYITAFKTGTYPAITQNIIYYWARPHAALARAKADSLGPPSGYTWTQDYLWAVVFATGRATVKLQCGSSSQTFTDLPAGINKISIPLAVGTIAIQMVKSSTTIINHTPTGYTYVATPTSYNYNAFVGAATAVATLSTSSMSSSSTPTVSPSSTTSPTTSAPPTTTAVSGWSYLGCYQDYSPRTLNGGLEQSSSSMTIESCLATCANAGYTYAGVEYSQECWCSNTITSGASVASSSDCNMVCTGNSKEICGGGNRINIYHASLAPSTTTSSSPTPTSTWKSLGCYQDYSPRTLNNGMEYASSSLTTESCQAACALGGYAYAGVEYSQECWCSNAITSGVAIASSSDCDMPCTGNSKEMCGGGNRINIYHASSSIPVSVSWQSVGCYQDYSPRTLNNGMKYASQSLTIESCQVACADAGYAYAGVEYSQECWCSNVMTSGVSAAASSDCNMPCTGNSNEICGGGNRINIYYANSLATGTATSSSSAATSTSVSGKTWSYIGCYYDSITARTLSSGISNSDSTGQTVASCLSRCGAAGYAYAGTEYSVECWCASSISSGSSKSSEGDCNMACSGKSSDICGGGDRISVYTTGTVTRSNYRRLLDWF